MRECVSYGYEVLDCQQHTSRSMGSQFAHTIFSTGGEGATTVSAGEEETVTETSGMRGDAGSGGRPCACSGSGTGAGAGALATAATLDFFHLGAMDGVWWEIDRVSTSQELLGELWTG